MVEHVLPGWEDALTVAYATLVPGKDERFVREGSSNEELKWGRESKKEWRGNDTDG